MKPESKKPFIVFAYTDERYYLEETIRRLKEDPNIKVVFCRNASEIMFNTTADTARPDIIITDASLHQGDQLEYGDAIPVVALYEMIRKTKPPIIPIVFYSTRMMGMIHIMRDASGDSNLMIIKAEESAEKSMAKDVFDAIEYFCPTAKEDPFSLSKPFPDGWEG
jgi:hypothetical protein